MHTGSADKRHGGGRPCIADTTENVDAVEALVLSKEDRPGTHRNNSSNIERNWYLAKEMMS